MFYHIAKSLYSPQHAFESMLGDALEANIPSEPMTGHHSVFDVKDTEEEALADFSMFL